MSIIWIENITPKEYMKLAEIEEQLRKDPNNRELLLEKATIFEDGNHIDIALKIYRILIQLFPEDADLRYKYVECMYYCESMFKETYEYCESILTKFPNDNRFRDLMKQAKEEFVW